jgi:hypothetical protein
MPPAILVTLATVCLATGAAGPVQTDDCVNVQIVDRTTYMVPVACPLRHTPALPATGSSYLPAPLAGNDVTVSDTARPPEPPMPPGRGGATVDTR